MTNPKFTNPKFTNKDGSPTLYAFCCGYEMMATRNKDNSTNENKSIRLFKEPACSVFQVQSINWNMRKEGKTDWNNSNGFRVWQSFDTLTEAKKFFYAECKHLNLKPNHRMDA